MYTNIATIASPKGGDCPRCGHWLRPHLDILLRVFANCIRCGYEDYQPTMQALAELPREGFRHGS